jgi:hypothetical protein
VVIAKREFWKGWEYGNTILPGYLTGQKSHTLQCAISSGGEMKNISGYTDSVQNDNFSSLLQNVSMEIVPLDIISLLFHYPPTIMLA